MHIPIGSSTSNAPASIVAHSAVDARSATPADAR